MMESTIQRAIIKFLEGRGCWVRKLSGHVAGTPDLMVLVPTTGQPVPWLIEVKQPGKKPSKLQRFRMEEVKLLGAWCTVAHRVADVRAVLELINKIKGAST